MHTSEEYNSLVIASRIFEFDQIFGSCYAKAGVHTLLSIAVLGLFHCMNLQKTKKKCIYC